MKTIIKFMLCMMSMQVIAQSNLSYIEMADGNKVKKVEHLVKWTHTRFVFKKEVKRVAVGRETTLDVQVVGGRELLILAKKLGRTSMMVWYQDNSSETFLLSVTEDYSVLENALKDIYPDLRLTIAPDRHAIVLRGTVPTANYRQSAYTAARNYLYASSSQQSQPVLNPQADQNLLNTLQQRLQGTGNLSSMMQQANKVAIINLIKVTQKPKKKEERIAALLRDLGAPDVTVERIRVSEIDTDDQDVFMLSGSVANQIELVRILSAVSKLFIPAGLGMAQQPALNLPGGGQQAAIAGDQAMIEVLANESGALASADTSQLKLSNVNSNVGRATLLSIAGGRVLSSIEVKDLPQIRVSVQLYEVNQRQLEQWRPDISVLTNGYSQGDGLFGLGGLSERQNGSASVENALQLISGQLTNNIQLSTSQFAIDMLFSLLEQEGISRTLSRPTLTVLAGESAVFKVGGEIPVPTTYSPSGIQGQDQGVGGSVFSGTEFKSFGVELSVRALVDEKDRITLDINPVISLPDTTLTAQIAQSSGSDLNSSAFNTRSMETSARLRDGQPLVVGGLLSSDSNTSHDFVPNASGRSLFGKLSESTSNSSNSRELIIVVTPTLVREPINDSTHWMTLSYSDDMMAYLKELVL